MHAIFSLFKVLFGAVLPFLSEYHTCVAKYEGKITKNEIDTY